MFRLFRTTFLICWIVTIIAFVFLRLPCLNFMNIYENLMKQDIPMSEAPTTTIYACDFEVFGKVQGVFFRKFTQYTAKKLQLRGWCKNTDDGSVQGQIEGPKLKIDEMKKWLREIGSPKSRIDRARFSDTVPIKEYNFKDFYIRR